VFGESCGVAAVCVISGGVCGPSSICDSEKIIGLKEPADKAYNVKAVS